MFFDYVPGWKGLWFAALNYILPYRHCPSQPRQISPAHQQGWENYTMWMTIGQQRFAITLEDNRSTGSLPPVYRSPWT